MAKPPRLYQALPGCRLGWRRLYRGPDHLLAVSTFMGMESYRRFFLRDIRAVMLSRTRLAWVRGSILGALGAAGIAWRFWVETHQKLGPHASARFLQIALFSVFGILLLLGIVDLLLGGTAALYLETAAGVEKIGVPRRWRRAADLLRELEPEIRAAQTAGGGPAA